MRETRLSSSMSGVWKQSKAMLLRHQQTKGLATARRRLNHCATRRLYPIRTEAALSSDLISVGWCWRGGSTKG